jgi:alginate O-acetyltransferase complex protein AlgI
VNLNQILLFAGGIILYRLCLNHKGKTWVLFIASLLAIFWLQPALLIRNLDFWLPFVSIGIVCLVWVVITPRHLILQKRNVISFVIIIGIFFLVSLIRYLPLNILITSTNPPLPGIVLFGSIALILFITIYALLNKNASSALMLIIILGIFVLLKNPFLNGLFANIIRQLSGQIIQPNNYSQLNLNWLGFSYISFRLIHVIRDFQKNRYHPENLYIFFDYVIFFPAIVAGPIDRIEHFKIEIEKNTNFPNDLQIGGTRIIRGLIKKYVIADSLALFAINSENVGLVTSPAWLWVMVLTYAWLIYFDFSGYTDIAIGLSALLGITLPENFNKPYLAKNLTVFWNRWHISLTQWIRAYFFNPFTRSLRSSTTEIPQLLLNTIPQITTMIVIGLWHGVTLNFFIWGLWHGFGLFIHTFWIRLMQRHTGPNKMSKPSHHFLSALSVFATFGYVSLGWIWFVIPDFQGAVMTFLKLFGR